MKFLKERGNAMIHVAWGDDLDSLKINRDITVIVIDVLRASTTIAIMLNSGASRVYPVSTIEDALLMKENAKNFLACGERNGYPPEGFDH
ncbi:MAG: 2-phosphosulfolactate phosphatase, partial [Promethearchaeota archaeon]